MSEATVPTRSESPDGYREASVITDEPTTIVNAPSPTPSAAITDDLGNADDPDEGQTTPPESSNFAESFLLSTASSTPLSNSARDHITNDDKNKEEKERVLAELGTIHNVGTQWLKDVFAHLVTGIADAEILKFLEYSREYNLRKEYWTSIPDSPSDEKELYGPLIQLIAAIIDHFYTKKGLLANGIGRKAVDTSAQLLPHVEAGRATKPDICIQADGLSFESPKDSGPEGLGYSRVASFVDAKLDIYGNAPQDQVKQTGVYSRQILLQQPNRQAVTSLIITESRVRLIRFSRSGVYITPFINFHEKEGAITFVRLILGISSPFEKVLGFDTSVQWTIDPATRRKTAGTITVDGAKVEVDDAVPQDTAGKKKATVKETSAKIVYQLNMDQPPLVRDGIRGRGTVVWSAIDPATGEAVIIKDSWRSENRTSEAMYLKEAMGIPGIGQILGYEDSISNTSEFWPPEFEAADLHHRTKLRVVLKCYGKSIWYFKSRLELFEALRDALAGHHELYMLRLIIHRDVSAQNVLVGLPDAPEGLRGLLIDLDMAVKADRLQSEVSLDPRSGNRMYQSIGLLKGTAAVIDKTSKQAPPHNYADDLESFFYVLVHIMFYFLRPGLLTATPPSWLVPFASGNPGNSQIYKHSVLLKELQRIIRELVWEKSITFNDEDLEDDEREERIEELRQKVLDAYNRMKASFDKAIKKLKAAGPSAEEIEPYPETPAPFLTGPDSEDEEGTEDELPQPGPSAPKARKKAPAAKGGSRNTKKRGSQDLEDEDSSRKRNCRSNKSSVRGRSGTGQRHRPALSGLRNTLDAENETA